MENDINKKIAIDIKVNTDGQQQIDLYKVALDSLRTSINNLSNPLNGLSSNISTLDKGLTKVNASLDKLSKQNKETESSGNKVKESIKSLSEMSDIFSNALKFVKAGVLSLEEALSGGLAIIVTFLPEIASFVSSLTKTKEAIDETKLSADKMNEALESSDYSNAVKQIDEFKINVDLAKKGLLNKTEVLKEYNSTLGKTMGQAANLDAVETTIQQKGDAYIQMTLLKAAAQLALQDAAKKAYEAERDKDKSDWDALTTMDKVVNFAKISAASILATPIAGLFEARQVAEDDVKLAKQRRAEAVSDDKKQKDAFLAIAKKYLTKAADIAKGNKLDMLGGYGSNNSQQLKQQRADALKETEKLFSDSRARQLQATYDAYGNETMAENKHYQDELARLKELLTKKLISKEQYARVSQQLDSEHHSNLASIIDKYNEQDKEKTNQAANELEELKIKAMKDGAEKQKAELNLQLTENVEQLDKAEQELTARITKIGSQINAAKAADPNADVSQLQERLNAQWRLIDLNSQKRTQLEKQTADAIANIDKQAAQTKKEKDEKTKLDDDKDAVVYIMEMLTTLFRAKLTQGLADFWVAANAIKACTKIVI